MLAPRCHQHINFYFERSSNWLKMHSVYIGWGNERLGTFSPRRHLSQRRLAVDQSTRCSEDYQVLKCPGIVYADHWGFCSVVSVACMEKSLLQELYTELSVFTKDRTETASQLMLELMLQLTVASFHLRGFISFWHLKADNGHITTFQDLTPREDDPVLVFCVTAALMKRCWPHGFADEAAIWANACSRSARQPQLRGSHYQLYCCTVHG